ncbi:MAG: uracil-DNA glycosylase [Nitrospiraceae bacterium]|nr:MAG: uracil-DNA glycosylase [Nitrospiraceae bacterium]
MERLKKSLEFYQELGFKYMPVQLALKSKSAEEQGRGGEELIETKNDSISAPKPSTFPTVTTSELQSFRTSALKALRDEIGDCRRCKLCNARKNIVFGEGLPNAELMFIGEGPGRDEDIQARPFVGEAGQLLTKLIEKLGFKRDEVYIANIVKCRPPGNREPEAEEVAICKPFLEKQIEIIRPKVIVSLGKISAHSLLGVKTQISRLRGNFLKYDDIPLMPTFHPAYLLRNPKDKWLVWNDMQKVIEKLKN